MPGGEEATELLGESKQYNESRNLSIGGSIVWDVTVNLGLTSIFLSFFLDAPISCCSL